MGWKNSHLHLFRIDGQLYGEPDPEWDLEIYDYHGTRLDKIFSEKIKSFLYEYDMGDGWLHDISLLRVVESGEEKKITCIDGRRACPPEDSGGPGGYTHLLEVLLNSEHEEYDDMIEWLEREFDPEYFDIDKVNQRLQRLR